MRQVSSGDTKGKRELVPSGKSSNVEIAGGCPGLPCPLIRDFISIAKAKGSRPTSIEQGRQILLRFETFLSGRLRMSPEAAGWQEYAAYWAYLAETEISRATIPLRPTLASVLRDHLTRRAYPSAFLFRNGKDVQSRGGQRANRQNAWRICKRMQRAAGVEESVHPYRFRKTLATYGKQMSLGPQFLQAILAHESVNITLDEYARVELEDVKRESAKVDLLKAVERQPKGRVEQSHLLGRLRDVAPAGKERAWQMIIEGLEGLLGE